MDLTDLPPELARAIAAPAPALGRRAQVEVFIDADGQVLPGPSPVGVKLDASPDGRYLVLRLSTPYGSAIYFLPADAARTIGEALMRMTSPIDVPGPSTLIVP